MTSSSKAVVYVYRKPSVTRSCSSDLGTVLEEREDDEDSMESMERTCGSGFEGSLGAVQTPEELRSGLDTGNIIGRPQISTRDVMKTKIMYHYMNPFQKLRARRRKPWKLVVQIVKVVLITIQICLFGLDRFSLVTFLENNHTALKHLFLKDYKSSSPGVVVYTRKELYDHLNYAHEQYYQIGTVPLGTYNYTKMVNGTDPPQVQLCYSYYAEGGIINNTYVFDPDITEVCIFLKHPLDHQHLDVKNNTFNLGRLCQVTMKFSLKTVNLKNVKAWDKPACYQLNVTILFDNVKHDGKMPVMLDMSNTWLHCNKGRIKGENHLRTHIITVALVIFDAVVISICTLSLLLCARSVYRSLKLAKETATFFKNELSEDFTFSDYQEFVSLWFVIIMLSDALTIVGSVYKMAIDQKDSDFYNVSSLFLGTAVLLVWIGLLRFLSYSKKYNVLLVTLKAATPSVARFCVCAGLLFIGFMFCGYIVLGPFHPKFKSLTITAECLYSMINGDDLFNSYAKISYVKSPLGVWIFSKIYFYVFIGLFIYVVLSLFIGIIGDTYERLKDLGHLPETKIQKFLHEPVNVGRTLQGKEYLPVTQTAQADAISTPPPREGINYHGRTQSNGTMGSMMRNVSIDSTGAE